MTNYKKYTLSFILILLCMLTIALFGANYEVVAEEINTDPNFFEIDEATYRVEETLEDTELYYGVRYKHDSAYTSIKDPNFLIGMACGGATYGNIPLTLNTEYHQSAHILTIPKDSGVKLAPWSIVKDGNWTLSTVLQVAKDYEEKHPGWKVIAATNSDFFDISANNPYPRTVQGVMVAEGEILQGAVIGGWPAIKFFNDGSDIPFVKVDVPENEANPTLYVYDENGSEIYKIKCDGVNSEAGVGETKLVFANYTNEGETKHVVHDQEVKNAYIVSKPSMTVARALTSFYGKGKIDAYGDATITRNQFAIVTNNTVLKDYLKIGVTIKVQNELCGELKDAADVTGCATTFLTGGKHISDTYYYDYMEYRYPRTLIGYKPNGDVVLAVTDGRQSDKGYYGLNGVESAAQLLYEGCVEGITFDGGGSTTMAILKDGALTCVNSPSDGDLRYDGNALLVVAKVPEIEITYNTDTDSIGFKFNVISALENYKELYIECDGKKKKIDNNEVKFDSLTSNTEYTYELYALVNENYLKIPITDKVRTDKVTYNIESASLKMIIASDGSKSYEYKINITDREETIATVVLIVDGRRFYEKDGIFSIPAGYSNPLANGELIITYEVDKYIGRISDEYFDLGLTSYDPLCLIDSIASLSDVFLNNITK